MDPISILVAIGVSLLISVVAALIAPKPKMDTSDETQSLENPTAEAGIPVTVVFGEITIKAPNVLWFGDKKSQTYEVSAE